jgi:hypothetical protein
MESVAQWPWPEYHRQIDFVKGTNCRSIHAKYLGLREQVKLHELPDPYIDQSRVTFVHLPSIAQEFNQAGALVGDFTPFAAHERSC